jgi:hypothetical protein
MVVVVAAATIVVVVVDVEETGAMVVLNVVVEDVADGQKLQLEHFDHAHVCSRYPAGYT